MSERGATGAPLGVTRSDSWPAGRAEERACVCVCVCRVCAEGQRRAERYLRQEGREQGGPSGRGKGRQEATGRRVGWRAARRLMACWPAGKGGGVRGRHVG